MISKKLFPQHGAKHAGEQPVNLSLRKICLIYRRSILMALSTISLTIKNIMSHFYCHKNPSVSILNIAKIGDIVGTIVKNFFSSYGDYLSLLYISTSKLNISNHQQYHHQAHRLQGSQSLNNRLYLHQKLGDCQRNEKEKAKLLRQLIQPSNQIFHFAIALSLFAFLLL